MKLIDKAAVVAEIKERIETYNKGYANGDDRRADALEVLLHDIDTIEVKEVDLENYNKVKKVLSLSFMCFLDENRSEGKMCLSNGECFDIEKAFNEMDFAKLFRYMEKYLKA